jgi:hypothetical protein
MAIEETDTQKIFPPYLPFATFDNFITELVDGVPNKIDQSVLDKKSGSIQSWLPKALEFFGLITKARVSSPALRDLVAADTEGRKKIYAKLVRDCYGELFSKIDMKGGTNQELLDWFKDQGLASSTAIKCAAFFIDMSRKSGVAISPHFKKISPSPKPKSSKKKDEEPSGVNGGGGVIEEQENLSSIPALKSKLILGLIEKLPDPESDFDDEIFPYDERELWLEYARLTFKMVYGQPEDKPKA